MCFTWCVAAASLHAAQDQVTPPTSLAAALPAEPTGEQIFRQSCATCHAVDGAGSPQSVVGFALPLPNGHDFPDFNDCPTNTVEPFGDWVAVATRGGPIRGLDRHMPAFGDALSPDQIEKAVRYLWTFCTDPKWPRGDLNFPRAFFTEKAFPENETVVTTGITAKGTKAITNEVVYEHRIGARGQYEVMIPVDFQHGDFADDIRFPRERDSQAQRHENGKDDPPEQDPPFADDLPEMGRGERGELFSRNHSTHGGVCP